ncbi:hypothetical protein [Methanoculleus sp.]|uniref:hypothetical protein n=1 Tax=Methanoculleus sp. TaxID=90427 RepID=UPI001BD3FBDE|nr:hypothetical protein [Methanoculleus sp.]
MILTIGDIPGPVRDAFARGEEVLFFTARAESRLTSNPEAHELHTHIVFDEDHLTPWQRALGDRLQQAMRRPVRRIPKRVLRPIAEMQRRTAAPSYDLFALRCTVQEDGDGNITGRLAVEVPPEVSENLDIKATAEKTLQRCRAAVRLGGLPCL